MANDSRRGGNGNATGMTLYARLADDIERSIRSGALRAGDRLPSVRQACAAQRVSASTVLKAYYRLESRGLIEARPKSGYYVRSSPGEPLSEPGLTRPAVRSTALQVSDFIFEILESVKDPDVVPFGSSCASPYLYPFRQLGRHLAAAARHLDPRSTVTDLPPGNEELRRQIAQRYLHNGAVVPADEIVVTSGEMEALSLCLQVLASRGDLIAVESPTDYTALQAIERFGLRVVEIPTHPREGVNLAALADVLHRYPVKACLLTLNFQSPMGALMPDEHRRALIALLHRYEIPLIEDDTYGELYFGKHPPRATKLLDDNGLVLTLSSFSKTLAPGYRIGWIAGGRFTRKIQRLKFATSLTTSIPAQIGLADYLGHGTFEAHLRRLRGALEMQEARMVESVTRHFPADTRLTRPKGGLFAWAEMPAPIDTLALHRTALRHGISIAPGPIFSAKREYRNCLRLNFGHPWTDKLETAIALLGEMLAEQLRQSN